MGSLSIFIVPKIQHFIAVTIASLSRRLDLKKLVCSIRSAYFRYTVMVMLSLHKLNSYNLCTLLSWPIATKLLPMAIYAELGACGLFMFLITIIVPFSVEKIFLTLIHEYNNLDTSRAGLTSVNSSPKRPTWQSCLTGTFPLVWIPWELISRKLLLSLIPVWSRLSATSWKLFWSLPTHH